MPKFILISPKNRTTYNFRGNLIKKIIAQGYEVIATGPNKEGVEKIEELGAHFEEIPLEKTGVNIVEDIKYTIALFKLFKKEKPDITLGYTIKPVIYGAIAAKLAKVKNINSMVTGVGYVFSAETFKARIIRILVSILYKISFKCSNTVIFQNIDNLNEFLDLKLLKQTQTRLVNGSGVNMKQYSFAPYPKQLTFFMLSRVLYSKGVEEYLKAATIIKRKHPDVKFMLLGAIENMQDSMPKKILDQYIKEKTIEYYSEVNDVREFYKKCSIFVLPSYKEGTPRTVLEAMSMSRPIITTNAPGCKETVINGENGFLVLVKNINDLVEKLEWFIDNQSKIKSMGEKSRLYCEEKFEINRVNKTMLTHLKINKKREI